MKAVTWGEFRLGAGLSIKHGFAFLGEYFVSSGTKIVLTPGNFVEAGGFKPKSGSEKYYEGPIPDPYLLSRGSVVVAMTEQSVGLLGSAATVPVDDVYLHNQRIGLVRITDGSVLDVRFVYHLMNSPEVRRQIQATATGAKIRHTAPERIQNVVVQLPPVSTQRSIAQVLDSIADLIENNRRRVELLEQMVQAIYREWFVHFRYPGHEHDELIDSPLGPIPSPWSVTPVRDLCSSIQSGGTPRRSEAAFWSDGTIPWYKTGDLTDSVLVESSERISEVAIQKSTARLFEPETILMAIYGSPTVGRLGLVVTPSSCNQAALGIRAKPSVSTTEFLWHVLAGLRDHLNGIAQGAAQQNVSKAKVEAAPAILPTWELVSRFTSMVSGPWRLAHVLARQTHTLVGIRDLLLPGLVTGRIDVSRLNLESLLEGAGA